MTVNYDASSWSWLRHLTDADLLQRYSLGQLDVEVDFNEKNFCLKPIGIAQQLLNWLGSFFSTQASVNRINRIVTYICLVDSKIKSNKYPDFRDTFEVTKVSECVNRWRQSLATPFSPACRR